jgi:uncharacterized membrane protein YccC
MQVVEYKPQLSLSLRVTVAALSSLALSQWLDVPLPLWSVLTAVILTQASFGRSLKATIDYLMGTLGGALYAGAVAVLIPHTTKIAQTGVLAIAVAPLTFLAAVNPGFGAAPFTGALVILIPGISHIGPVQSAVYRVLEVAVGGITALAVSLLVFPARAHSLAISAAAQMLDLVAQSLPELFVGFVQIRDAKAIERIQNSIGQAFARLEAITTEAKHERLAFLANSPDHGSLLRTLLRLRHDLVMIGRASAQPLPETFQARLGPQLTSIATIVADYLHGSGEALIARSNPPSFDEIETVLNRYAEMFASVRRDGLTIAFPQDCVERIFTLAFAFDQTHRDLIDLDRCVRDSARSR